MLATWLPLLALGGSALASPAPGAQNSIKFRGLDAVSSGSVHNVHLTYRDNFPHGNQVRVAYGDCNMKRSDQYHHEVASLLSTREAAPDRLIWKVPRDIHERGCLHAYTAEGTLLGRSEPIEFVESLRKRQALHEIGDSNGLWFDGVRYLESKNKTTVSTEEAKSKSIAIVGGGMAGLMTSLLLDSVGMTNWHIVESSERVGGRVRTMYLNGTGPDDYQYQEMGPMRFVEAHPSIYHEP